MGEVGYWVVGRTYQVFRESLDVCGVKNMLSCIFIRVSTLSAAIGATAVPLFQPLVKYAERASQRDALHTPYVRGHSDQRLEDSLEMLYRQVDKRRVM